MQLLLHVAQGDVCVLECKPITRCVFPRSDRLSRRVGFSRVLKQKSITRDWFSVYSQPNSESNLRLGISISKRVVPGAVQRNSIKRLVRECFRHHMHDDASLDVVIRLRKPLGKSEKSTARVLLNILLDKVLIVR